MLLDLQLLGLRLTDGRVSLYADRTLRRVFFFIRPFIPASNGVMLH